MYAANMSWKPVQRILSHLVEQGLLTEVLNTESKQSKRRYQITQKGEHVLDYFEKAKDILPLEDVYAGN
jgi:predicted transcriptional regulator